VYATSHIVSRNASPANTALYKRDVSYEPGSISSPITPKRSADKGFGEDPPMDYPGDGVPGARPPGRKRYTDKLFGSDKANSARDDLSSETRDLLERDGLVDDI